jgi:ribonucleoside-diphosphate reductase alpha chain
MMMDFGVEMHPENGQGPKDYNVEGKRAELNETRKKFGSPPADEDELEILIPEWDDSRVDTWVLSFPEKAPEGAITKDDVTAIEQLEWYKKVRVNWCEHNQSITVYVRDNEWLEVGNWVYNNFDIISGVSFLPFDGGSYQQAPYEACTQSDYEKMIKVFPKIDYSKLSEYEKEDNTTGAQNLACASGSCEIP